MRDDTEENRNGPENIVHACIVIASCWKRRFLTRNDTTQTLTRYNDPANPVMKNDATASVATYVAQHPSTGTGSFRAAKPLDAWPRPLSSRLLLLHTMYNVPEDSGTDSLHLTK